ncbi:hypothetical protein C8J56DRAFT_313483 [Mycena floridula]|nr:hypothetical protein C8J56DRAFT_313483 [Mycena floridula]
MHTIIKPTFNSILLLFFLLGVQLVFAAPSRIFTQMDSPSESGSDLATKPIRTAHTSMATTEIQDFEPTTTTVTFSSTSVHYRFHTKSLSTTSLATEFTSVHSHSIRTSSKSSTSSVHIITSSTVPVKSPQRTMATFHTAPGLALPPAATPTQEPVQNDGDPAQAIEPPTSDDSLISFARDPDPYPTPVHKSMTLLIIFLSFIGFACGFFAFTCRDTIRRYMCCSDETQPDEEQETVFEKDLTRHRPITFPSLVAPMPVLSWMKPVPPAPLSTVTKSRVKVFNITQQSPPRSRFSDYSSEYSDSARSSLSDPGMTLEGRTSTDGKQPRGSDASLFSKFSLGSAQGDKTPGGLAAPARDDRWSLEQQRISRAGSDRQSFSTLSYYFSAM